MSQPGQMQTKTRCEISHISIDLLVYGPALLPVPWLTSFASSSPTPRTQIYLLMLIILNTDELDTCAVPSLSPLCIWHLLTEVYVSALKPQEKPGNLCSACPDDLKWLWNGFPLSRSFDSYKCTSLPRMSWGEIKMLYSCKLIFNMIVLKDGGKCCTSSIVTVLQALKKPLMYCN